MIEAILGLLLRHGLTILGGILVNKGFVDANGATEIIGSVTALAGVGLSALNKVNVVKKLDNAAAAKGFRVNS